jgi:hypothetical protein
LTGRDGSRRIRRVIAAFCFCGVGTHDEYPIRNRRLARHHRADVTFDNVRLVARAIARRVLARRASSALRTSWWVRHAVPFGDFARPPPRRWRRGCPGESGGFAPTRQFPTPSSACGGCVVITASHNPPQYSGVKFRRLRRVRPVSFTRGGGGFGGSVPSAEMEVPSAEARWGGCRRVPRRRSSRGAAAIGSFDARGRGWIGWRSWWMSRASGGAASASSWTSCTARGKASWRSGCGRQGVTYGSCTPR